VGDRSEAGPELTVRRGDRTDDRFIVGLGTTAFARFGEYRSIMEGFLDEPEVTSYVAWENGARIGFALLDRPPSAPGLADMVAIAVDPAHQRKGVGRALLARVIAECSSPGRISILTLTVAGDNDGAIALFRSEGFAMLAGSAGRYAGGQESWRMVRRIERR
jgi:ribosomal protein S18 acetylase RimI-like enzyme